MELIPPQIDLLPQPPTAPIAKAKDPVQESMSTPNPIEQPPSSPDTNASSSIKCASPMVTKPPTNMSKTKSSRKRLIGLQICLLLASTSFLTLLPGFAGVLSVVDSKLHHVQTNTTQAESRNIAQNRVKMTIDRLTEKPLPLRIYEDHTQCLVRGVNAAYSVTDPYDFTEYGEMCKQAISWAEESCEKIFHPDVLQSQQKLRLVAAFELWSQKVEDLTLKMRQRLGNTRGWILAKWAGKPFVPHQPRRLGANPPPRPTSRQMASPKTDLVLIPSRIALTGCETSRCRLIYVPGSGRLARISETCKDYSLRVNPKGLQGTRDQIVCIIRLLKLLLTLVLVVEFHVRAFLFTYKCAKREQEQQNKSKLKSVGMFIAHRYDCLAHPCDLETSLERYRRLEPLEKTFVQASILRMTELLILIPMWRANICPASVCLFFTIAGSTAIVGIIHAIWTRCPPPPNALETCCQVKDLFVDVPSRTEAEINENSSQNASRIFPATSFPEDLNEETRVHCNLDVSWHNNLKECMSVSEKARTEGKPEFKVEDAPRNVTFEDVDLHDNDSESEGSDWSIVEDL
ncbi:hypothetical protein K504DRAFT_533036 [Pleomassaria siparia CBS 279.74]|uniref:Nidogen G2 beta-barrel domain-containing protein n=1 Tax=Pleomassaria siparia CBS 279.74 TaxID=1314801 RepID=A0A6G1KB46_9PLEO|nr:hypothetical protein K504DRAFT_533036 [Pleomassaria siparia CBS 279.74]